MCSLLEMFSRESDEKFWALFVLSSTSTVRGFATGTWCANNVHGENFLKDIKDGMKKGDACIPLICFFLNFILFITSCSAASSREILSCFSQTEKNRGA